MSIRKIHFNAAYESSDEAIYPHFESPQLRHVIHPSIMITATVLHLLGTDHQRFTHRFQGLDYKLTGVEQSRVVKEILL